MWLGNQPCVNATVQAMLMYDPDAKPAWLLLGSPQCRLAAACVCTHERPKSLAIKSVLQHAIVGFCINHCYFFGGSHV